MVRHRFYEGERGKFGGSRASTKDQDRRVIQREWEDTHTHF